jgi:hypothetical protein
VAACETVTREAEIEKWYHGKLCLEKSYREAVAREVETEKW